MAGLYDDAFVDALRQGLCARRALWGLGPGTAIRLITVSENATFRADDPEHPEPVVLRVHRPGYHTAAEIASELAWIEALRAAGVVHAPAPLPACDGRRIVEVAAGGATRHAVAFAFMEGVEPAQDARLVAGFRDLGAISARLHAHARHWRRPEGFVRKTWDFATTVGARPHWGDWRAALGLEPAGRAVLERLCTRLEGRLAAYGQEPDRFGLIHADLRLANLLVADERAGRRLGVIDFDDCGFGWFMYDFAAAVSFFEHDPLVPDLAAAWVAGYRTVAPLGADHAAMLPTLVMLRRLLLTAWIASHPETPTARDLGAGYTAGTVRLAERFLADAEGGFRVSWGR